MVDLDPETFDITDWLSGRNPEAYRNTETVTVYLLDPALTAELDKVKAQHAEAAAAEAAGTARAPGTAEAEPPKAPAPTAPDSPERAEQAAP